MALWQYGEIGGMISWSLGRICYHGTCITSVCGELILHYKRESVDSFGQIPACFLSHLSLFSNAHTPNHLLYNSVQLFACLIGGE